MVVVFRDPNIYREAMKKVENLDLSLKELVSLTNHRMSFLKKDPSVGLLLWEVACHVDDLFESEYCEDPQKSILLVNVVS